MNNLTLKQIIVFRQFKKCTKCDALHHISLFAKHKKTYDGYQAHCKLCTQRWRQENAAYLKSSKSAYRKNNKDKVNASNRRWRAANPEKAKSYSNNWRLANPEVTRAKTVQYRTRKKANEVFVVSKKFLKKLYASECVACGSTQKIHADHIIPVSRGGRFSEGNLQPLCWRCNLSKNDRFYFEWKISQNVFWSQVK